MRIRILDTETANKIAAGEIVENPAAVVKELVENSLDAGSKNIKIYLKKAGMEKIRVIDDGAGIYPEDLELAFSRHATNKIIEESDLFEIKTLGFRGEALASIASVSKIEIKTRQKDQEEGIRAVFEGGELKKKEACGCPVGTDIEVHELFYNTPARFKFLKKTQNELGRISDIVNKLSLGNPEVSFTLFHDDRQLLKTSGKGEIPEVIASIYGFQTVKQMLKIKKENNVSTEKKIKVEGYVSKPELTRASRNYQVFIVNGRYVRSKLLTNALEEGYKRTLPKGRFPVAVVNINVPYEQVDVNVHPAKLHLRFDRDKEVIDTLKEAVGEGLLDNELIFHINPEKTKKETKEKDESTKEREKIIEGEGQGKEKENLFADKSSSQGVSVNQSLAIKEEWNEALEEAREVKESSGNVYCNEESEANTKEDPPAGTDQETTELLTSSWKNFRIIGQVFLTYWIVEKEGSIFFIDQHALHERINYEKFLKAQRQSSIISQNIIPFTLEIDSSELILIENNLENIKELGLDIEKFGNNTLLVRAVPYIVKDICDGNFLRDFITSLVSVISNESKEISLELSRLEEILISTACKKSIKANQKLTQEEFENLIFELKEVSNPYTCPHGRPTIIKFTQKDLEKFFKRIK